MTTANRTVALRLTTAGTSGAWHAQLRQGTKVIADCGHTHRNRYTGAANASHCGRFMVMASQESDGYWTSRLTTEAVSSAARARALGARITDEDARDRITATLAAWHTAVTEANFQLPRPF